MQFTIETQHGNVQPDGRRIVTVRGLVQGSDGERQAITVLADVFVPDQDSRAALDAEAKKLARIAFQRVLEVL